LFKFGERHLPSPVDILKVMLALSRLLPDERHWPGDGQPKKWPLLLRYLYEHDKVEACLNHLSYTPSEQHDAYIERLMREAYAAHKAEAEGEAAQTLEAATDTDEAA